MFFGEGKKAFLEFLRNLTPQILFLSLAFIWAMKLDLNKFNFSPEGFKNAAPLVMFLLVFFGAAIANIGLFIDTAVKSTPALDEKVQEIKSKPIKPWQRTWHLVQSAWKYNKPAFFQILLVLIICETAMLVVFITAVQGAAASPLIHK